jgi:hypothetical protein
LVDGLSVYPNIAPSIDGKRRQIAIRGNVERQIESGESGPLMSL